jgi:DGQHR domain-containing protein
MKFTLARRKLENANIDKGEENVTETKNVIDEHNLFSMSQQDQNVPPEEKIIDVHEDLNEDIENQDNIKEDNDNMGEVHEINANKGNEKLDDESLREKLRMMNKGIANLNSGSDESKDDENVNDNIDMNDGKDKEDINVDTEGEESQNEEMEFVFENVIPIYRNGVIIKYQTTANAEILSDLWNREIIEYQGNLQRGYVKNKKGENVAVYNSKHVKEILESILTQKIHAGFITLNALNSKPIKFNPEDMTLSILPKQKLQVLDGQHRLRSFAMWSKLKKRKPEQYISPEEFYMPLIIETLNEESAKSLFSEYATKPLKISTSRSLFLDVDSNINRIARRLMSESELKNRVEVIKNTISKKSDKIVSFSVISKGIKNNFKPSTQRESDEIANHLILFFNELVNTFPEIMGDVDLTKKQELKERMFTIDVLAFYAYFVLGFEFYNTKGLEKKLKKLKDIVKVGEWEGEFLSKENPLFKPVLRENNRIINTSSTMSYMSKVIVGYVAQGKSIEELMSEK